MRIKPGKQNDSTERVIKGIRSSARRQLSHGEPNHPQTQGKIERWYQALKNCITVENYYLPEALKNATTTFVERYIPVTAQAR